MKKSFSIFKTKFTSEDYARLDHRFKGLLDDWRIEEEYRGNIWTIPPTANGKIYPYKYFEMYHTEDEPKLTGGNFIDIAGTDQKSSDENEAKLVLGAGWPGMNDEVLIILSIMGHDLLQDTNIVHAQIIKLGGTYPIKVYYKDKLVTDFTKERWWNKLGIGKPQNFTTHWIVNMLEKNANR